MSKHTTETTIPLDQCDALRWRCIGPPRGGRVVAVAGDYRDPLTFYFGACAGGVWKTTDGGTYWECVSDGFLNSAAVGAIATTPSDANVVYAGTGESTIRVDVSYGDGVYRTVDAGRTWQHLGLAASKHIGAIEVHPTDPDLVYVAALGDAFGPNAERGVFRSRDGGQTWEHVLDKGDEVGAVDLSMDPTNPRILFATMWRARRTFWSISSGGPDSGLYVSMDGGDSWESLQGRPGFPTGTIGKVGVAVSGAKQGRVYALVEASGTQHGLYRSEDYGQSWEHVCGVRDLCHRPWYYMHVTADSQDADTVYVNNLMMWKSIDGGCNFTEVTTPHGDNHALWIDPNNPQRMVQGNDGGACVSYNGGDTWTSIYNQLTAQIYRMDVDSQFPYRVYGTQQDNTSISVPSAVEWGRITLQDCTLPGTGESGFIVVRPDDPDVVFVGAVGSSPGGNGVLQRFDAKTGEIRLVSVWPEEYTGKEPRELRYRFAWTFPISFSPHDPRVLYAGGNHVFQTADDGATWDCISPDLSHSDPQTLGLPSDSVTVEAVGAEQYATCAAVVESPHRPGEIWAATDDGRVHVRRVADGDWENVTPPDMPKHTYVGGLEISGHDADTVYLAATRYKLADYEPYLWRSSDGGRSWCKISSSFPAGEITRVIRVDSKRSGLLFVGTETGMYCSQDDGESWQRMTGGLPVVPVYDIRIKGDDLVVATHGRSFWIADSIEPLRQSIDSVSRVHLFTPPTAVRMRLHWSAGLFDGEGKDYAPAFGLPGTSYRAKLPDGTEQRRYLDVGENPPAGAIIDYWLADATDRVRIEITNANGDRVAYFDSQDDSKGTGKQPPAKVGLNRFIWDLCEEGPIVQDPELREVKLKVFSKRPDPISGPLVTPGIYQVKLLVAEHERVVELEVLPDPRIQSSPEDLQELHQLHSAVCARLSALNVGVNRIRFVKRQLGSIDDSEPGFREWVTSLRDKLTGVEHELVLVDRESARDVFRGRIGLDDTLMDLGWSMGMADARPPAATAAVAAEVFGLVDDQLKELDQLLGEELGELNRQLRKMGIPVVNAELPR